MNTDQKEEFAALGIDGKPWPQEMETKLMDATMSCSDSEENEPNFYFGGISYNRDATMLAIDDKDVETKEALSSDAPMFHPGVILSDHTYVTKRKEQHMKISEDISDSISLLVSPSCVILLYYYLLLMNSSDVPQNPWGAVPRNPMNSEICG